VGAERKDRRRRPPRRVARVWSAEEWLARTDWWRFAPQNPKRQAYEIIRGLAKGKLPTERKATSWVERTGR